MRTGRALRRLSARHADEGQPRTARLFSHAPNRRSGAIFLQLVLAAGLMWFWARSLSWPQLHEQLRVHHALWLVASLALAVAATQLRAWRLQLVIAPQSRVGWLPAFCITWAYKLASVLIPLGGGELLRMLWLRRSSRVSVGTGAAALVNDHVLQLGGAALFLAVLAGAEWIVHDPVRGGWAVNAAAGGAGLLLAALAIAAVSLPRVLRNVSSRSWIPLGARDWLLAQSHDFGAGALYGIGNRRLMLGIALTMGAFVAEALMLMVLFASLGMKVPLAPSLTVCLMLVPGGLLPTPGGVGVVEVIGTFGLGTGTGLHVESVAAGVLAWHIAGIAVTFVLGTVAIAILGWSRAHGQGPRQLTGGLQPLPARQLLPPRLLGA